MDNYNWTSPQSVRGHRLAVSETFCYKTTSEYFCHFEKLIGVLLLVTTLLGFCYRNWPTHWHLPHMRVR